MKTSLNDSVIKIISTILGITQSELNLDAPLDRYGFDSILGLQLVQHLQNNVDPSISLPQLKECRTIRDVLTMLPSKYGDDLSIAEQQKRISVPATWPQFPELILLNSITT